MPEEQHELFTDLGGRFSARLSAVWAARGIEAPSETTGVTAKYQCQVKAEYQKDLMGLLEEGMLLAVRNFKSSTQGPKRFSLLEISRLGPEHYGLKGLTDQSYYPYQFEIIQQAVQDWDTDDKSTMMIQMSAIPLNYDLVLDGKAGPEYVKGFTYPVIGECVSILNKNTIHQMYNKTILERMGRPWQKIDTTLDARKDPRLGTVKMFENEKERVPIYVDFERLVRYHFGIFGFTGSGKSNLLSNILRRLIYHTKDTKIVIFDISMEYPFLLLDVFSDPTVPSKIILEGPVSSAEQLYKIVVKPRGFEKNVTAKKAFETMMSQDRVGHYAERSSSGLTYEDMLHQLSLLSDENAERATSLEAIETIKRAVLQYMKEKKLDRADPMDEKFVDFLSKISLEAVEKFKIWKNSGLYGWAQTRDTLKKRLEEAEEPEEEEGYNTKTIANLIEGEERLVCLSIVDPNLIKSLAINLSRTVLMSRKKEFKVEPLVLLVFDETQEFIPAYDKARGIERECTIQVETLLRQGRKYGLGGCLATQRIAYLNTNALQQLHTYFVGPMPRPYDRSLVSNTFTIDQGILEKTLEFAPGEWLLSSYIATGMENVPIFIKADNTETEIQKLLQG
jgi:hypothetical protein